MKLGVEINQIPAWGDVSLRISFKTEKGTRRVAEFDGQIAPAQGNQRGVMLNGAPSCWPCVSSLLSEAGKVWLGKLFFRRNGSAAPRLEFEPRRNLEFQLLEINPPIDYSNLLGGQEEPRHWSRTDNLPDENFNVEELAMLLGGDE